MLGESRDGFLFLYHFVWATQQEGRISVGVGQDSSESPSPSINQVEDMQLAGMPAVGGHG